MKKLISLILAALLALSTLTAAFAATYTDKDTVKKVQQALNDAGYECGTPDGIAGKKTAAAITQYRTDKGLEVSDTIDDALLEAMGLAEADKVTDITLENFIGTWKMDIVCQFDDAGNVMGSISAEEIGDKESTLVIAPDGVQLNLQSTDTITLAAPELKTNQENGNKYLSAAWEGGAFNFNFSYLEGEPHIYIILQDLMFYFKRIGDVEDTAIEAEEGENSYEAETKAERDENNVDGELRGYVGVWKFCALFDSKDVVSYYPEELGIDPDTFTIDIDENSLSCVALGIKGNAVLEGNTISVATESGAFISLMIDEWKDIDECIFVPADAEGQSYVFKRA